MITDALDGKIDLIITKSLSRFARNTVDALINIRKLKSSGVEVFFQKENIYTLDSNGEFLLTLLSSMAQEESRSMSENISWGQRRRFAKGKYSVPYKNFLGYDRGDDDTLVINDDEAKIVRLIYKLFLFGLNESAICKYLESNNIPTPSGLSKWHKSTVRSILTNEKYKGDALLQKKFTVDYLNKIVKKNEGELPQYYIEKGHEPIVSNTVFDLVQHEFGRRKAFQKYYYTNAFSSKIKCSCCKGAYIHLTAHSDRASKAVFWRCRNFYDGSVHSPNINDDYLQQGVQLAIMSLILKYNRVISDCASMLHKALPQYSVRKYNDLIFSLLTKSAIERTYDLSEFRLILDYIEVNENKKIRFCFVDGMVVEC